MDEAGFPQTVVALLEGYAESISPDQTSPMSISIPDLKVVRTAIGVLLNASVNYGAPSHAFPYVNHKLKGYPYDAAPVKRRLVSLEAAMTILKLSISIYPPGSWLRTHKQTESVSDQQTEESWSLRTGLLDWAWRAIAQLRDEDEESSLGTFSHLLSIQFNPNPNNS